MRLASRTASLPVTTVAAAGLDPCDADGTAHLEPVPTDVEVGRHGMLHASTLPGGPEDGSLGANGSVYRVHPGTEAVERVEVAEPAAVEWHSGRLSVSSGVFTEPGAVVALRLPRS